MEPGWSKKKEEGREIPGRPCQFLSKSSAHYGLGNDEGCPYLCFCPRVVLMVAEFWAHICVGCPRWACFLLGLGNRAVPIGLLAGVVEVMAGSCPGLGQVREDKEEEERRGPFGRRRQKKERKDRGDTVSFRQNLEPVPVRKMKFMVLTLGLLSPHVLVLFDFCR